MIGHLDGRILELQPGLVVLEAGGVGYEVHVPISAHPVLVGRSTATLHCTPTSARTSSRSTVSRPAASATPSASSSRLGDRAAHRAGLALRLDAGRPRCGGGRGAVAPPRGGAGDRPAHGGAPDRRAEGQARGSGEGRGGHAAADDAVSALLNLGYPVRAAEEAVGDLLRSDPQIELSELLRRALQTLVR